MNKFFIALGPLLMSASLIASASPARANPVVTPAIWKFTYARCAAMDTTTDKSLQTQMVQSYMAQHEPEAWDIVQRAMNYDLSKWGTLATYQVMETCGHHYPNR